MSCRFAKEPDAEYDPNDLLKAITEDWHKWAETNTDRICAALDSEYNTSKRQPLFPIYSTPGGLQEYVLSVCKGPYLVDVSEHRSALINGLKFTSIRNNNSYKSDNSVVMVSFLSKSDKKFIDDHIREHGRSAFSAKSLDNPAQALAEGRDPYPGIWFGRVRRFLSAWLPGSRAFEQDSDKRGVQLADVQWFNWPDAFAARHDSTINCPVVMKSACRVRDSDDTGYFAWCKDIAPVEIVLAPKIDSTTTADGRIMFEDNKWHVLSRDTEFYTNIY